MQTKVSSNLLKVSDMYFWNIEGAVFKSKQLQLYLNKLQGVIIIVYYFFFSFRHIL